MKFKTLCRVFRAFENNFILASCPVVKLVGVIRIKIFRILLIDFYAKVILRNIIGVCGLLSIFYRIQKIKFIKGTILKVYPNLPVAKMPAIHSLRMLSIFRSSRCYFQALDLLCFLKIHRNIEVFLLEIAFVQTEIVDFTGFQITIPV